MDNVIHRKAKAEDLDEVADVLAVGFGQLFHQLTRKEDEIRALLRSLILLENFYVVEVDGRIAGCLALSAEGSRSSQVDSSEFRRIVGLVKGTIGAWVVRRLLTVPYELPEDTAYFEYVTILPEFRRRGLSSSLIMDTVERTEFRRYMLDVTSDNMEAYQLYEKLGFREVKREKERFAKQAGFEYRIYMALET